MHYGIWMLWAINLCLVTSQSSSQYHHYVDRKLSYVTCPLRFWIQVKTWLSMYLTLCVSRISYSLVNIISGLLEKDEDLDLLFVVFPDILPLEIHFIASYEMLIMLRWVYFLPVSTNTLLRIDSIELATGGHLEIGDKLKTSIVN